MTYVAGYVGHWTPSSWRNHTALHQPVYSNQEHLTEVLTEIQSLPPLVTAEEVLELRKLLAESSRGKAFVVQAGDCAESFSYCRTDRIDSQANLIARMAETISLHTNLPVVRIGRIAGQYAKPRSSQTETINGQTVLSFFGENVNAPSAEGRAPDPARLKQGYLHAAETAAYLRTRGAGSKLFLSHEALILPLEEAMTRHDQETDTWYNSGAHMLWIGERTRGLKQAHVEYARGIANPIGIKVGPAADTAELIALIRTLNPSNDPGKIVLITRFGTCAANALKRMIPVIQAEGLEVLWLSDPMHGNTKTSPYGIKTRLMTDMVRELEVSVDVHLEHGTVMNGLHLEIAAENVTECVGGTICSDINQLHQNYQSLCDPRLNPEQAVTISGRFASAVSVVASRAAIDVKVPSFPEGGYYAERECGK